MIMTLLYLLLGSFLAFVAWVLTMGTMSPIPAFLLVGGVFAWFCYLSDRQGRLEAWLAEIDPEGARRRRKAEIDPQVALSERERIKSKMEAYAKAHEEKREGGK